MNEIIESIRKELKDSVEPGYDSQGGFKEKIKSYRVRVPVARKIGKRFLKEVEDKEEAFSLCEKLLSSGWQEEGVIAFSWAYSFRKDYEKKDFKTFERWLDRYVSNWALCDDFCTHALGFFILKFPDFLTEVKKWTASSNRWLRRGAAVTLIPSVRKGKHPKEAFEVADLLLLDEDDMVQKGYGWLLKEASKKHPNQVFNFVLKRKDKMPRTALRYSIEKFSEEKRKKAMA